MLLDRVPLWVCGLLYESGNLVWLVVSATHVLGLQYLTVALVPMLRPFMFAFTFSSLMQLFGPAHFGKLVGLTTVASAAATFLQTPLLSLTLHRFHRNFTYLQTALAVLLVPLLLVWPWHQRSLLSRLRARTASLSRSGSKSVNGGV